MEKKPLRVIQVGAYPYVHAAHIAGAVRAMPEEYELCGLVTEDDASSACAGRDRVYAGLRRMTWEEAVSEKPDAFLIENEEHSIVPAAIRALDAGFPVHIDKPGGEDHEEFAAMCRLAKDKKLPLSVGYMYRHNPAVLYALGLAREGKLGEIISVEGQMSCLGDDGYRRSMLRYGAGMMFYLGCHMTDLAVHFLGFPEKAVPFNVRTGYHGIDCYDSTFCVLCYPKGASFVKVSCMEQNGRERRQFVISGTEGTVEIRPIEAPDGHGADRMYAKVTLGERKPDFDKSEPVSFGPHRRYDGLLHSFASYVRGEAVNPYTPDYEEKLHALILETCRV